MGPPYREVHFLNAVGPTGGVRTRNVADAAVRLALAREAGLCAHDRLHVPRCGLVRGAVRNVVPLRGILVVDVVPLLAVARRVGDGRQLAQQANRRMSLSIPGPAEPTQLLGEVLVASLPQAPDRIAHVPGLRPPASHQVDRVLQGGAVAGRSRCLHAGCGCWLRLLAGGGEVGSHRKPPQLLALLALVG